MHEITAHFKVSDMMQDCDVRTNPNCWGDTKQYNGINLMYAAGHCHAPSCIRKVTLYYKLSSDKWETLHCTAGTGMISSLMASSTLDMC